MGLGESAGRSARNRTGQGAERRNTPRERALIDPVFPEGPPEVRFNRQPPSRLTPRGESLLNFFAWSFWIVFCVMFAIVICAWWGLV